jgi:hypothetical protein
MLSLKELLEAGRIGVWCRKLCQVVVVDQRARLQLSFAVLLHGSHRPVRPRPRESLTDGSPLQRFVRGVCDAALCLLGKGFWMKMQHRLASASLEDKHRGAWAVIEADSTCLAELLECVHLRRFAKQTIHCPGPWQSGKTLPGGASKWRPATWRHWLVTLSKGTPGVHGRAGT